MITMNEFAALAAALVEAERLTSVAEQALKDAKENERILREETLPSAMQELGVDKLELSTGQKVSMKQEVYASLSGENKERAFDWLEQHGFGGMIKTVLSLQYAKGELVAAERLAHRLLQEGLNPELKRDVHAQTLKAFLREQLSAGNDVPLETFNARPVFTATVK